MYECIQFLSRTPRRKTHTGMNAVSESIRIDNFNNIIPTKHILYLSLVGLYELLKDGLAGKIVLLSNIVMQHKGIHLVVNVER